PHPVPVSAIATAPHSFDDVRKIILHLSLPHIFDATSSALPCVSSFELRPYFRVLSSNARAPYPAAAGAAVASTNRAAANPVAFRMARCMYPSPANYRPTVTAAIREACDTLIHAHSSYYNVQEIRLAERLARVMPDGLEKSLFLQSGSDANEAAVMIARQYTGGYEVASPHVSFHGLSDTARSLTFAGWHKGHGPLPGGSQAIVAPYCYRCPLRQTFPACNYACLDTSFELIDAQSTGRPAAVITEPLFSAGGVIEPPP